MRPVTARVNVNRLPEIASAGSVSGFPSTGFTTTGGFGAGGTTGGGAFDFSVSELLDGSESARE